MTSRTPWSLLDLLVLTLTLISSVISVNISQGSRVPYATPEDIYYGNYKPSIPQPLSHMWAPMGYPPSASVTGTTPQPVKSTTTTRTTPPPTVSTSAVAESTTTKKPLFDKIIEKKARKLDHFFNKVNKVFGLSQQGFQNPIPNFIHQLRSLDPFKAHFIGKYRGRNEGRYYNNNNYNNYKNNYIPVNNGQQYRPAAATTNFHQQKPPPSYYGWTQSNYKNNYNNNYTPSTTNYGVQYKQRQVSNSGRGLSEYGRFGNCQFTPCKSVKHAIDSFFVKDGFKLG